MLNVGKQLPLSLQLRQDFTFENFCSEQNATCLSQIQLSLADRIERFFYLWSVSASGKTHLLQACCNYLGQQGRAVTYIPLKQYHLLSPQVFDGLESLDLIAIDDIDTVATMGLWEDAIFHLFNRVIGSNALLIMSGKFAPLQLKLKLPDLSSRIAGSLVFQVHELSDEDKTHFLISRAKQRGLDLSAKTTEYLLARCSRNMHDLCKLLDQLDHASLAYKRPLTIPFIKEVLNI